MVILTRSRCSVTPNLPDCALMSLAGEERCSSSGARNFAMRRVTRMKRVKATQGIQNENAVLFCNSTAL
jgi:DNA-directed RNA polymerase subunit RPC12/RpoP